MSESLNHGINFIEGFGHNKDDDKPEFATKLFDKIDSYSDDDNHEMEKLLDDVNDSYQQLYCLKNEEMADLTGKAKFGSPVKNGENIGKKMSNPSQSAGFCFKPTIHPDVLNHTDKILTLAGKRWYVNKYGYKKEISGGGDFCNQKDVIELQGEPTANYKKYIEFDVKSKNKFYQACDSGNYNLFYRGGGSGGENIHTQRAYLSPSGILRKYSVNPTDTPCGSLREFESLNSKGAMPFDDTEWKRASVQSGKFDNLKNPNIDNKTKDILNCFPYVGFGDGGSTEYSRNLKNKLKSELNLLEFEKKYITGINKFVEVQKNIRSAIEDEYGKNGGHKVANEYYKNSKNIKKLIKEADKEYFKTTVKKINSEQFHQWMWIGSALALGAISIKLIRNI